MPTCVHGILVRRTLAVVGAGLAAIFFLGAAAGFLVLLAVMISAVWKVFTKVLIALCQRQVKNMWSSDSLHTKRHVDLLFHGDTHFRFG